MRVEDKFSEYLRTSGSLRRETEARSAWAAFAIAVMLVLAMALALHFIARASAQGLGFTTRECAALAHFARTSAEIRDLEARLDKHIALVRKRVSQDGMKLSPVLERELRRVYLEGHEPEKAEELAYSRCMSGELLRRDG